MEGCAGNGDRTEHLDEGIFPGHSLDTGDDNEDKRAGDRDNDRKGASEAVKDISTAIGMQLPGLADIVGDRAEHDNGRAVSGA